MECRLSVGTARTFGCWKLFVTVGGDTFSISISRKLALELVDAGISQEG